jgi:hypothetical protein
MRIHFAPAISARSMSRARTMTDGPLRLLALLIGKTSKDGMVSGNGE